MSRFLCLWLIKPDIFVIHPVDGLLWLQEIDVAGPICVCVYLWCPPHNPSSTVIRYDPLARMQIYVANDLSFRPHDYFFNCIV